MHSHVASGAFDADQATGPDNHLNRTETLLLQFVIHRLAETVSVAELENAVGPNCGVAGTDDPA
jgi:hypothetical protein